MQNKTRLSKENKDYLTYVAKYLGVALISGSVVHIGTLQNGITRYIVLMLIGLVLMMIGNIREAKANGQKINLNYLATITLLSFATGFLSGGVQHYLDNPSYAGWLLGLGIVITYITFFLKDKIVLKAKNTITVIIFSAALILVSNYVFDDTLLGANHHEKATTQTNKH